MKFQYPIDCPLFYKLLDIFYMANFVQNNIPIWELLYIKNSLLMNSER
jgi:hypothetical protein